MLEQANVVGHAVCALPDGRQHIQDATVGFARIGLAADREAFFKAELGSDAAVHLVDLVSVAIEEIQKARLRAGGAAAAEKAHGVNDEIKLLQICTEVLHPQRRALADGHGLRGLIVRVAQSRGFSVFARKYRQVAHHAQKLPPQIPEAVAIEDEIGVICYIAAGRPQMNDAGGGGRSLTVSVHMRHHIMAHLMLPLLGHRIVDVGDVRSKLVHLFLRDGKTQPVLCPGQGHPQSAPGLKARVGGKEVQHIFGGIAGRKRGLVNILTHGILLFFCSDHCSYFI